MSLAELRQKRAEAVAKAEQITDSAIKENRDLTETDNKTYDALKAEIASIDANIKRLEEITAMKAAGAQQVLPPPGTVGADDAAAGVQKNGGQPYYPQAVHKETPEEKADIVGGMLMAVAKSQGNVGQAIQNLEALKDNEDAQRVTKALNSSTPSAGGLTVQQNLSDGIIELLRGRSVVRAAGPGTTDLAGGNLTIARLSGGASGFYIGEGTNITVSEQTLDSIQLSGKMCAALVPISNTLLRRNGVVIDPMVRDDMLRAMATTSDVAFLMSAGSLTTPKGLRYWADAGNVLLANATINLQNITSDLGRAEDALAAQNVTKDGRCWFMHEKVFNYLKTLRDGNGNLVYQAELNSGRLNGYPVQTTTNIPYNLGAGSDETLIMLVAMPDVIIGEEKTITIDMSREASYTVGGVTYNAYQRDETLMRAITVHDLGVRHPQSVAVLTGVKWKLQ